jgi:hypothetical protein
MKQCTITYANLSLSRRFTCELPSNLEPYLDQN